MSSFLFASPTDDPVYKITPSMLTFLYSGCKRCFYLKARNGLHRPWMPFPKVFEKYHTLLQAYFTGRSPHLLHPSLPHGQCLSRETWVESEALTVASSVPQLFIRGRLDHLMQFDDGTWGLIDYKTTEVKVSTARLYSRQLHAYAWALEHAADDAVALRPITRMGLLCLDPVALASYEVGERALAELRPVWVEVERNDDRFRTFLTKVAHLLARSTPPPASSGCTCCQYLHRRTTLEAQLAADYA